MRFIMYESWRFTCHLLLHAEIILLVFHKTYATVNLKSQLVKPNKRDKTFWGFFFMFKLQTETSVVFLFFLPFPELRRTPPRNSLLSIPSLSHTVSSRHIPPSCSRLSSLYTNVLLYWGFRFFFTMPVFLFVFFALDGNKWLQTHK